MGCQKRPQSKFNLALCQLRHRLSNPFRCASLSRGSNECTDYGVPPDGPLNAHFPTIQTLKCSTQDVRHVLLPTTLTSGFEDVAAAPPEEQQESVYDLLEYLDMLFLGSPRVQATDRIDPFLSRYAVPDLPEIPESTYPIKILTWTGLIPSRWIMQLTRAIM